MWLLLFTVCFATAALGLALTIVIEASPARHRSLLVTAVSFGGGAGAGVTAVFYPLLAPAVFLMGVGPITRWNRAAVPELAAVLLLSVM